MTRRDLPSVHELLGKLQPMACGIPHDVMVSRIRRALAYAREDIKRGDNLEPAIQQDLAALTQPSLRHVINATGVILHTNLGRAPLAQSDTPGGYSNLEYDLSTGKRGRRDSHTAGLLEAILGKPAIVVNNNAAALFLILNELAAGAEVIVSRGELIEIGDGFRIPEIMSCSGAVLREVGTTNRTVIEDYRAAITDRTRVLLRVHQSNFRMTGFTARPELCELVQLGGERNLPVYEDLGSGCLVDLRPFGIDEPLVQASLAAGVNLVSFSGDKLLGGPQAGIIAGDAELVTRVRRNPLYRALRQDKLFSHAMEPVLRHIMLGELDSIPALGMIRLTAESIRGRALALCERIGGDAEVEAGESAVGGGSTPDVKLPTWLISVGADERRLRLNQPPIIVRTARKRVLLDLRTVFPEEEDAIVQALS